MQKIFIISILLTACGIASKASEPPTLVPDLTCFTGSGSAYRGTVNMTVSGKACQMWSVQSPHKHDRTPENYPSKGLEGNYCRNPDGEGSPWCYTTYSNSRWEYCKVLSCRNQPGLDLSGKMFTFPKESNTARVKLQPSQNRFSSVTVCLRFRTQLARNYSLFSLASDADDNDFLIYRKGNKGDFDVVIRDKVVNFKGLPNEQNTWYSICATWESNSGLSQVWISGNPSARKVGFNGTLDKNPTIILGQEQDSVDGGYKSNQSFVGKMTDVHMWDYVISACQIKRFANNLNFTPGNVLNWKALNFNITGDVKVEKKSKG
ncbi:C-reactive protein-like [Alosa pseudoharengus]|uniref:C-reactive protein-like n=1 Tax=Alosa pseudoharengus TaxID=34774 RepID=UPI003F88C675